MSELCSLHHPHIVDFYGAAVVPNYDVPVLVYEQLHRSLASQRYDPATPELGTRDCVDIAIQISNALIYLHEREEPIVHGNLTPTNVFLTASGGCKISDIGLAKMFNAGKPEMAGCESLYIPPNLSAREQFTCSVDIYSLGVILLEILVPVKLWTQIMKERSESSPAQNSDEFWERELNASQRKSATAKRRFGKCMEYLHEKKDICRVLNVLLQITRPTSSTAQKKLVALTANPEYRKSSSTLGLSVEQFVSELHALREAIGDTQVQFADSGAQLQVLAQTQQVELAKNLELSNAVYHCTSAIPQEMKVLLGDLYSRVHQRFDAVDATTRAAYGYMSSMVDGGRFSQHAAPSRSTHASFSSGSGHSASIAPGSFEGSFDESGFQFESGNFPLHRTPYDAPAQESSYYSSLYGDPDFTPRQMASAHDAPDQMQSPGQLGSMGGAHANEYVEGVRTASLDQSRDGNGMAVEDDWSAEAERMGLEEALGGVISADSQLADEMSGEPAGRSYEAGMPQRRNYVASHDEDPHNSGNSHELYDIPTEEGNERHGLPAGAYRATDSDLASARLTALNPEFESTEETNEPCSGSGSKLGPEVLSEGAGDIGFIKRRQGPLSNPAAGEPALGNQLVRLREFIRDQRAQQAAEMQEMLDSHFRSLQAMYEQRHTEQLEKLKGAGTAQSSAKSDVSSEGGAKTCSSQPPEISPRLQRGYATEKSASPDAVGKEKTDGAAAGHGGRLEKSVGSLANGLQLMFRGVSCLFELT